MLSRFRERLSALLHRRRRLFRWLLYASGSLCLLVLICNVWVIRSTRSQIFSDVSKIPARSVGLVLGANKISHGRPNLFFQYRIEAAVALFRAGKIKHIIVSGDNSTMAYDESTDMHDALVSAGIPDSCITLDFAGFRTFDSVVRCLEIFGQKDVTVISQEFHNERALFIANYYRMNALAFSTKEVPLRYSIKTSIREYFAKCKAVLDLYVLHTQPHFLGEKVPVKI